MPDDPRAQLEAQLRDQERQLREAQPREDEARLQGEGIAVSFVVGVLLATEIRRNPTLPAIARAAFAELLGQMPVSANPTIRIQAREHLDKLLDAAERTAKGGSGGED
jgi:hypothetical protein